MNRHCWIVYRELAQPKIMMKMTKFLQYLESSGKFRKNFSTKYIEVYISRKTILSDFHSFFFNKNIMYTSEVIPL